MASGAVESPAAGYQPERGVIGGAVNHSGRELGLAVLAHPGHPENCRDSVGESYVNSVARVQRAKPEKDSRAVVTIDVSFDDGRPDLTWRRRVLVPRRLIGAGGQRRHRDGPVRVYAQAQQF
jgi:hypothetical protein